MPDRAPAPRSLTLGQLALCAAACLVFAAASLLALAAARQWTYDEIRKNGDDVISKSRYTQVILMTKSPSADELRVAIRARPFAWLAIDQKQPPLFQERYYRDEHLIAIDHLDESHRLARRDYYGDNKRRIQVFYNPGGEIERVIYVTKKGTLEAKRNQPTPLYPPRIIPRPY